MYVATHVDFMIGRTDEVRVVPQVLQEHLSSQVVWKVPRWVPSLGMLLEWSCRREPSDYVRVSEDIRQVVRP